VGLTVVPGAPAALALRVPPTSVRSGERFTTPPSIEVRDAQGNLVTSSSVTVTASIGSGGGTLGGTTSQATAQGIATFADLTLRGTVGNYSLTFSAPALTAAVSPAFSVQPGQPAALAIRTQPGAVAVGSTFSAPPVVEVRDADNNLVTEGSVTITATVCCNGTPGTGASAASNGGLATFSALTVVGRAGDYTISFSATGVRGATSSSFALRAGAASALGVQTAASGGGLNSAFATPLVLEVRDAGGNVITQPAFTVTGAITSGGGTLTNSTATSVSGVVTFASLRITGSPGARTLAFSAPGLSPLAVPITPCDASRGAALSVTPTTLTLRGYRLGSAITDTVRVSDTVGSCQGLSGLTATTTYAGATGWLTATAVAGGKVALAASPGSLPASTVTASVSIAAAGATPVSVPIAFEVRPAVTVAYGSSTQKVVELAIGGSVRPSTTVADERGTLLSTTPTFTSRSPTIVTVGTDGTITGRASGGAWVVASDPESGARDSVFVPVRGASGPVVRLDVTGYSFARGSPLTVTVQLDTRGVAVGAAQILFVWPTTQGTPGLLTLTNTTPGSSGAPVITTDAASGVSRISVASASGLTGIVTLGTFTFSPTVAGSSQFVLRFQDLLSPAQQSLLESSTALQYPVVIR
jgi:hypothetical protein